MSKLGPGRSDYYFGPEPLVPEAGDLGLGQPSSFWIGAGPASVGLSGRPELDQLRMLEEGRHPVSGERLADERSRSRVQVTGFDLTFCAPKSVSLVYALGEQEVSQAALDAHRGAVGASVSYVERRALAVRRQLAEGRVPVAVEGPFSAAFEHATSRALDPHLHSHVVIPNLGADGSGRFSALDGRGVYAHAGAIAALYHAELRQRLTSALGVAFGPLAGGRADLEGVGIEARRAFSRRAAAIAARLEASGRVGPRVADLASLVTRPAKDTGVDAVELLEGWRATARATGLGPGRLSAVLDRVPRRARPEAVELDDELAARVSSTLVERGHAVGRRDIVRAMASGLRSGASAPTVERVAEAQLERLTGSPVDIGRVGVGEARFALESLALDALSRQALEARREPGRRRARERPPLLHMLARDSPGYEMGLG